MTKFCKYCLGKRFIVRWQFPYVGGKIESKKLGKDGEPINGRKVAFPCGKCNHGSQPKVIWTGPGFEAWLTTQIGDSHVEEESPGLKEVVDHVIHTKI